MVKREVKGESRDDERQGTDPWDILLRPEWSQVMGSTSWGFKKGVWGNKRAGDEDGVHQTWRPNS